MVTEIITIWLCIAHMVKEKNHLLQMVSLVLKPVILNLDFFFFFFLGPYPQPTEVPRLGVKWKLQLAAYATATAMQDPSLICDLQLTAMLDP